MPASIPSFLGLLLTLTSALVLATWVLSTKISSSESRLASKIADSETRMMQQIGKVEMEVALIKGGEKSRDEKLNEVYSWWITMLKNNWIDNMALKNQGGRGSHD